MNEMKTNNMPLRIASAVLVVISIVLRLIKDIPDLDFNHPVGGILSLIVPIGMLLLAVGLLLKSKQFICPYYIASLIFSIVVIYQTILLGFSSDFKIASYNIASVFSQLSNICLNITSMIFMLIICSPSSSGIKHEYQQDSKKVATRSGVLKWRIAAIFSVLALVTRVGGLCCYYLYHNYNFGGVPLLWMIYYIGVVMSYVVYIIGLFKKNKLVVTVSFIVRIVINLVDFVISFIYGYDFTSISTDMIVDVMLNLATVLFIVSTNESGKLFVKRTPAYNSYIPINGGVQPDFPENTIHTESYEKTDNIKLLLEYKELLDMGAITQEEFEKKKKELL